MIRPAFALLLLALPLAAQEDVAVTALTLDTTSALTGERVSGTLTVRNNSTVAVQNMAASVLLEPVQQEITVTAPAGWSCGEGNGRNLVQCRAESLAANAQAVFRFTFLTRNDLTASSVRVQGDTLSLPAHPGYLQLDLGEAGAALEGAETAWVRIEPRTEGLRFWAFASVTNNPTGHVTTVTPQ